MTSDPTGQPGDDDSEIDEHVLNVHRTWGDADIENQRPIRRDWPYLAGVLDELCEWLSED